MDQLPYLRIVTIICLPHGVSSHAAHSTTWQKEDICSSQGAVDTHLDEEANEAGLHINLDQGGVQKAAHVYLEHYSTAISLFLEREIPAPLIALQGLCAILRTCAS